MTGSFDAPERPAPNRPDGGVLPQVPDHEIILPIGRGSSGEVWLGKNVLGTYRAIKVVYERNFRHRRPYDREFTGVLKAEPVSRLHEGLVDILQVGRNDAGHYFYCVMELADDVNSGQSFSPEGYVPRTLEQEMFRRRRVEVDECAQWGASLAAALSFLHKNGLTHRDIKPSNIIFINGIPRLADIGLVDEMTGKRDYLGTEGFIPPEGSGTQQADIYSLGKVLYEISTGKDRHDYPELPVEFGKSGADRALVQFNKIVFNACRADPFRRYKSAEEMMFALLAFNPGETPSQAGPNLDRWIKAIGVTGAIVAAAVLYFLVRRLLSLLGHGG